MTRPVAANRRKLCVVVHALAQAVAALRAGRAAGAEVAIWSAPGASAYLGAGYFAAMERAARRAAPHAQASFVLDCADRAGDAMAALRAGVTAVCFTGPLGVRRKLADMARQCGARVVVRRPPALDLLGVADPLAACRAALGRSDKASVLRSVAKRRGVV
ncbi:MAG: hypothetical protein AB7G15_15950 [Alphaproteobacteria bacterium]